MTLPANSESTAALPHAPGVYRFMDRSGAVIYVGKAKDLRRRVASYFLAHKDHAPKVTIMLRHAAAIEYTVVKNETDALLLENSLIKELQPRYNILLKDDKSYPWIVVRNEPFPRVQSTRTLIRDGSQYFGPYGSGVMQHAILEFLRNVVPLRTCKLNLAPERIASGKYSVCLQYHIGNCKGPCVGRQSEEEYNAVIDMVRAILRGDLRPVRTYLVHEMEAAAERLQFELAAHFKGRLDALDNYTSKSVIVSPRIKDIDVFSLLIEDRAPRGGAPPNNREAVAWAGDEAFCNFLRIRHGSIVGIHTVRLSTGLDAEPAEMLSLAIQHIIENIGGTLAREVIVPLKPSIPFGDTKFTVPQRGEKLELLEFSLRSARIYRAEQLKNLAIHNPARHTERLMAAMQKELRLPRPPHHIECFDNSNLQGTHPVASCVVFRDGKPSRKEYRHFNVKTVVGADDFASMREIVYRRYSRLLHDESPLPDLIIVDGGKGQLSSAYAVLEGLGIADRVPIVGLAKRIEEVFYPNDPEPYYLSRTGEPLRVIRHIRDEAHRFGITFHRQKRDKAFIHSELEDIPGIGDKTIRTLMQHFRTVEKIKAAPLEEISALIGPAKANTVFEALAR